MFNAGRVAQDQAGQGASNPLLVTQNETHDHRNQNAETSDSLVSGIDRDRGNSTVVHLGGEANLGSVTDDEISQSVRSFSPNPRFVADKKRVDTVVDSIPAKSDSIVAPHPVQPVAPVEKSAGVQPVAPKQKTAKKQANVQPVAPKGKARRISELPESVQMSGFSWRPDGFTGWNLWKRTPAISANNKRSSKHKWVAHYKKAAMERLINETKKRKAT